MGCVRPAKAGFSPLDEALGLLPVQLTPILHANLVRLWSWMPFGQAVEVLKVVTGGEGSGRREQGDSVEVAGKSGSAQNAGKLTHALFVAYAPADDPQIAVAVILEERGHGGQFAAPVAQSVLDHYFHPDRYLPKPDSLLADSTAVVAALVARRPARPSAAAPLEIGRAHV